MICQEYLINVTIRYLPRYVLSIFNLSSGSYMVCRADARRFLPHLHLTEYLFKRRAALGSHPQNLPLLAGKKLFTVSE